MASNPLVPQGSLNKLLASVSVVSNPSLNVGQGYLAEEQVSLTFDGDASGYLGTQTGAVPSPNPYQMITVTVHALRTQTLSNLWKQQIESNTSIGDVVVYPDSVTLDDYTASNCTIQTVQELEFAGRSPAFVIVIKGTYYINASLFS